jgi:hypothetical protein
MSWCATVSVRESYQVRGDPRPQLVGHDLTMATRPFAVINLKVIILIPRSFH